MRISVITVCRNAASTIGEALESFFRQSHPDKELVVVDGASSDGTLAVVRSFEREGLAIISEPDAGIYDAMNKGLGVFRGDAVGFLNADDRFHDPHALTALAAALERADICYGDLDFVDGARRDRVVRRWRSINGTLGVSHLVGPAERPSPVPTGVVEALIAAADARGVLSGPPLEAGQTVRIIAGAFADQLAVIERLDEAGRVRVLLEIVTGTVAVTLAREMLHETR